MCHRHRPEQALGPGPASAVQAEWHLVRTLGTVASLSKSIQARPAIQPPESTLIRRAIVLVRAHTSFVSFRGFGPPTRQSADPLCPSRAGPGRVMFSGPSQAFRAYLFSNAAFECLRRSGHEAALKIASSLGPSVGCGREETLAHLQDWRRRGDNAEPVADR